MQIQIDRITAPYIGKWMRFTGRVHNVVSLRQSTMLFLKLGNNIATYAMEFETAAWADHLSLLAKGSDVAVLGKIAKIGSIELFLIDCELVETE